MAKQLSTLIQELGAASMFFYDGRPSWIAGGSNAVFGDALLTGNFGRYVTQLLYDQVAEPRYVSLRMPGSQVPELRGFFPLVAEGDYVRPDKPVQKHSYGDKSHEAISVGKLQHGFEPLGLQRHCKLDPAKLRRKKGYKGYSISPVSSSPLGDGRRYSLHKDMVDYVSDMTGVRVDRLKVQVDRNYAARISHNDQLVALIMAFRH